MSFDIEKELNRITNVYRVGAGLEPACEICHRVNCRCHAEPDGDYVEERNIDKVLDDRERADDMRRA